ncbi:hypothetical protein CsatA_022496 [Cannabis sativa]
MRTNSLFTWLYMFSILLGVNVFLVSSQCLDHQQALLLQLRKSLEFDPEISTKLVKWNAQNSDCCHWEGVSCKEGHVVDLNLSNEGISGELGNSSSLFGLQHLNRLDLSCNFFSSMIPTGIGNLKKLNYLNLSSAGFLGQIPSEMSHLRRLITLDLSTTFNYDPTIVLAANELKLENPTLKMLVQNLSMLEELYFDGVNMSTSGSEWCQDLSSSLPNLRVLSFSDCSLSGPFDQSLVKLQSLSVIRLDNNDLLSRVPEFLANFSWLSTLSLHSCQLYGAFPGELFKVPTLMTLDLTDNVLLSGSLPEFPRNNSLRKLMLPFTNFSKELPSSIGNLWNLSTLDLSFCHFSGTIPSSISKLTQLSNLQLSFNNFTGPIPSFNKSKKLTQIDLNHNSLTGEIPSAHCEGLLNLVEIDLEDNFLKGSIPSTLFELPLLKKISLAKNQFNNLEFQTASSSILTTLDLSSNNLEGPFLLSILKLKNLSSLDLSYNKLNGTLQLDIFQELDQLAVLDLSYNNWSVNASVTKFTLKSFPQFEKLTLASCNIRAFPNLLKNQLGMVALDLSNNRIHGEIPNWIWEVGNNTNLAFLNLSHNHLVGMEEPYSLPSSLSLLDLNSNYLGGKIPVVPASIGYVDLSNNNFTSSIPIQFFNDLSSLGFFSISNNSFSGVIPESICSASGLQVLDLSHNKLSGKIPRCLFEIGVSLEVLNLRQNNLRGPIQDAFFPTDCDLKTLDLNGNSIQGKIPKSLANCAALEVLDLGHNNMVGEFPCLLKNTTTLQVLVLRSNNFAGTIGCPNTNGTWEMLQILDLAQNNFSGVIPGQWLKTMQAMMTHNENLQANVNTTNSNVLGFTHLYSVTLNLNQMSILGVYYRYIVTVTSKGQEMKLPKILNIFISIDLSSNNLQGPIPAALGELQALTVLNLSNNAHTGKIPSSIGDLRQLESLDLSRNNLIGSIPTSLEQLTFLSFLNLSYNNLVGRIPMDNQFRTFSEDSFVGNKRLCGFPLMNKCLDDEEGSGTLLPNTRKEHSIDWNVLSVELGFVVGFGIVFGPLLFCKRWRQWHYKCVDDIVDGFFPLAVSNKWFLWTKSS